MAVKPKRTVAASRGFLAAGRLSCYFWHLNFSASSALRDVA